MEHSPRLSNFFSLAFGRKRFFTWKLKKILEIGAGTGANFRFHPKCDHAIASEISLRMIDIAKHKANGIELVHANAELLPFAANHFDAAFATLVFCSVPSPELAFGEIRRVLMPRGRLIMLEHVRPKAFSAMHSIFSMF